jgi:hypothetical protein
MSNNPEPIHNTVVELRQHDNDHRPPDQSERDDPMPQLRPLPQQGFAKDPNKWY